MPLHLQHHKSYHPYNRANIERVRQDEEHAQHVQTQKDERARLAESEARLDMLRNRNRGRMSDDRAALHEHSAAGPSREQRDPKRSVDSTGDELQQPSFDRAKRKRDEPSSLLFGSPMQNVRPWYQDKGLQSERERKKTPEQRLEDAYKDSIRKRSDDPLRLMPSSSSSSSTTASMEAMKYKMPAQQHQREKGENLRLDAQAREIKEQARVEALLQAQAGFRIDNTPRGSTQDINDEYNNQYHREDVRAAKSSRHHNSLDFRIGKETIDPGDTMKNSVIVGQDQAEDTGADGEITLKVEDADAHTTTQALQPIDANSLEHSAPLSVRMSRTSTSSDSNSSTDSTDSKGRPKESMYPAIFGEMISIVMESEAYLFTEAEQILLKSFFELDYEARHLFARLIQRRSSWHRVDKLNYDFDVTDRMAATRALCTPNAKIILLQTSGDQEQIADRFCLSEREMEEGFEEPLAMLTLEELKVLAKNMNRLKGATTKSAIIASLLTTKSQGTLHGFSSRQKDSDVAKINSQAAILREQLTEVVGGCVRVCPRMQKLVDRVALVYYRGTELGASALTTAVLSRSRKRTYPNYVWKRSEKLFQTRAHLLGMQTALELEMQMEQWIEFDGSPAAIAKAMSAFDAVYAQWDEAVLVGQAMATDVHDLSAYNRMRFHPGWPLTRVIYKGVYVLGRLHQHDREAEVLRKLLDQKVFRRGRRGDWYDRLALITMHYPPDKTANAIRKAKREALSIAVRGIEDPDTHLIYHDTLQRRIVRLENQLKLPFSEKHDFSYAKLRKCEERTFYGVRLDKMMGERKGIFGSTLPIPGANSKGSRASPTEEAQGEGFTHRAPLRKVVKVERVARDSVEATAALESRSVKMSVERREIRKDMHSVWRGLNDGDPCRVEELVLQHYALDSFKGFHCEGGVLTMLFALLMWDVVFMHVDGVFETPYQRQPLDLQEDSFSIVRGPALRNRLMEIENTGGLDLIRQTDERERERKTWAVGCRWDQFSRDDLLEIAECMGGKALSVICQMLAEEWGHCTAGMPDLCVWRYADKEVRFCEVKGPGDKLSEKQKLWIDVLLRAGIYVEVSKVQER